MVVYNEDWIHFVWTRYLRNIDITEDVLKEYIYSFKDTQITDFAMNVNGTVSTADSKIFESFADKYLAETENGFSVDYKNTYAKAVYELIYVKKIDIYSVWIDACREIGINPWISIRINDCHGNMENAEIRKSSYVDANPELHIASYRERIGYFDKCFDYSVEKAKNRMIAYIDEMLDRYDVYGLELDMMREFIFTKPGFESEVNGLLKEIFKTRRKYEEKYGHEIKLSLLLPCQPQICLERCIDVIKYKDEIDYIVIIPRWQTSDTDMPIELWKQILRGTDINLGCGQQLYMRPYPAYKPFITSVKMAFGQAIANLSRGSDFVYLYNYMDMAEPLVCDDVYDESIRNDNNRPLIFGNIGEIDTLLKQDRSHVVTYCDYPNYSLNINPRLPIKYTERSGYQLVKIPVGKIPENAEVKIILGISAENKIIPSHIKVYANSAECHYIGALKLDEHICSCECHAFSVTENMSDIIYAEIRMCQECSLEYVELEVVTR